MNNKLDSAARKWYYYARKFDKAKGLSVRKLLSEKRDEYRELTMSLFREHWEEDERSRNENDG